MRIVIDLQGAQSAASRNRGVGRYSLALAQGIARHRGDHEVFIALSGAFSDTIEPIRAAFAEILPIENIRVWIAPSGLSMADESNDWRRMAAEKLRESFLATLKPDVILVASLFEGLVDDAVTTIGELELNPPTAVVLYDLIPWIHQKPYLDNPSARRWYEKKIEYLRRAQLWLSISESSRQEGLKHLSLPENAVVNVSTAADPQFQRKEIDRISELELRRKYGLARPFVMYTGGIDHRKNIEGLIRAYAAMPASLRAAHQLAIVCAVQPESRRSLEQLAARSGLNDGELVLTGFVPEEDLITLYHLCKTFVFPSWHEGFGLPALEAMHCGAPVIAANTSSLPEVVGNEEGLFDPFNEKDIAEKISQVLSDEGLRKRLIRSGLRQAQKFSWDTTAKHSISALETLYAKRSTSGKASAVPLARPKLAYISPLPSERSGIADYSAELIPALAQHYDIDVVIAQEEISDSWINANCSIRSIDWFRQNGAAYERILYHFGNSAFHEHMFELLRQYPGVVVLHDFFLSGIQAHREVNGLASQAWCRALYESHGYYAVHHRFHVADTADTVFKYPANFEVIQNATGTIVHSTHSKELARNWYGAQAAASFVTIPHLRTPADQVSRHQVRQRLGFSDADFIVASFGLIGPTKLNHQLLDAWLASALSQDKNCVLVFVGQNDAGPYGKELLKIISSCRKGSQVRITGWTDTETFRDYLASCDVAVQLRSLSRGETSGTVLDCMNHGVATIVNAHGSMADLDQDAVLMLPDQFMLKELENALELLWRDKTFRTLLSERGRRIILERHVPLVCAQEYYEAIERFYLDALHGEDRLIRSIGQIRQQPGSDQEVIELACAIAQSLPQRRSAGQLFVDISELVQRDARTGIQRVTRSILKNLLEKPIAGYRVEPVYATLDSGYRYARQFTLEFIDCPKDALTDAPIDFQEGDIFLGLDLQPQIVPAHRIFYRKLQWRGVKVAFVVYDLLPYLHPQFFDPAGGNVLKQWLNVVAESDIAVCISKSVSEELSTWLTKHNHSKKIFPAVSWFHLGADISSSVPTKGVQNDANAVLEKIGQRPSFLMVGTIEPRKGYAQVLAAFEKLWESNIDINLVIVGKQGWMVESLIARLRSHGEVNRRLLWLEGISDEYLEKVYGAATCLIVASEGEGFGLPLIEAAQHRLPIIARDIPVFREVAGSYASYFSGLEPGNLINVITDWLEKHKHGTAPLSVGMPWLTWEQSTQQLLHAVLHPDQPSPMPSN